MVGKIIRVFSKQNLAVVVAMVLIIQPEPTLATGFI